MCCGIWHLDIQGVQHISQKPNWFEIRGIQRPSQDLVMFLKPFLSHFCSAAGCIILLEEATAIWEYQFHKEGKFSEEAVFP